MKKVLLLAIACCALVFSSCHRQQTTYTATFEYTFANPDNATSVKAILNSIDAMWIGDYTFTGNDVTYTDLKADAKFRTAIAGILLHRSDLATYFEEGDILNYKLYRNGDDDMAPHLLIGHEFKLNENGNLSDNELYNAIGEDK